MMNSQYFTILLVLCFVINGTKPALVNMYNMLNKCPKKECNPFFAYINYGCYCGIGGGGTPVDEIDM